METGEKLNNHYSYISKSFNKLDTEKYHLSLDISLNRLCYTLLNIEDFSYILLSYHSISNSKNKNIDELIKIINSEDVLKSNFSSSSISYSHFPSTIVPKSFYQEKNKKTILEFNHNIFKTINTDSIDIIDSKIIYSIPENLDSLIKEIFPSIIQRNTSKIIIDQLIEKEKHSNEEKVFIFIDNQKLEIIILKKNLLVFHNIFEYKTPEDLLYYVLFCYNQLKLSTEKTSLILFGDIKKGDKYFNILYNYIRYVSFGCYPENLKYCEEILKNIQKHKFFPLFSQVLCA